MEENASLAYSAFPVEIKRGKMDWQKLRSAQEHEMWRVISEGMNQGETRGKEMEEEKEEEEEEEEQ